MVASATVEVEAEDESKAVDVISDRLHYHKIDLDKLNWGDAVEDGDSPYAADAEEKK